jgi:hypothetical protein
MKAVRDKPDDYAVRVLGEKIEEVNLGFASGFASSGISLNDRPILERYRWATYSRR